jgi:methyl-accepting chemotaxis protein
MSLRSRIALIATLLVLAAIVVNTLLQTFAARRAVLQQAQAGGDGVAESLARAVAFAQEVPLQVEDEIGRQMQAQAALVAQLVAVAEKAGVTAADLKDGFRQVVDRTVLDEILATDSTGRITLQAGDIDFTFSPDPAKQPQAHVFHKLLGGDVPVVVQESRKREIDSRVFKYAGVGGVDKPRIVQVGMEATFLDRLYRNLGLRRLVNELVAGEVREVRILDSQLTPIVTRRVDERGSASDADLPLVPRDAAIVRDCIAGNRPVGRFESGFYRVATPVKQADGRSAGAVLVTISTKSSRDVLWWQAAGALASSLVVGLPGVLAALWLARSIADPVRQSLEVAEAIAEGDLTGAVPAGGDDEVGRLLGAFGRMSHSLGGLIGRIQAAGERLSTVEEEAAGALARQDRAVRDFSGSATEISSAVSEISATSEELLGATSEVTEAAREAARVADEGRGGLESMTASMQHLDEAMNAFTRKLSTISQRASGITSVVTTIAKVADQTNLLSVNATIEAEKAGESGRGFRIVAQEIRRLADQTALATQDIERMVRDMQAAVSSGTMEMDRFRNEVSQRIAEVAGVSERLGRIIEPVQSVTRSLEHVHEGMHSQSQGARQIRDAMESLRSGAGESAASMAVFTATLDELRRSISELNAEASRFRTGADQ